MFCPGKLDLAGVPTNLEQLMVLSIPLLTVIPVPLVDEVAALASALLMKITPTADKAVNESDYVNWYLFWRVILWKNPRSGRYHRASDLVRKRIDLWKTGRFASLWAHYVAACQTATKRFKNRPMGISDRSVGHRATRFIEAGEISKAVDQFNAKSFLIPEEEIYRQLKKLHPEGPPVIIDDGLHHPEYFSEEDINATVVKTKSTSAAGPDGLSYRFMKQLSISPSWITALTFYINSLARGDLATPLRDYVGCARLVAIPKNQTTVRPIAIGNALRRVLSALTLRKNIEEIMNELGMRQLGTNVSCGVEAMYHLFEEAVSQITDGESVFKADFSNAFNNVSRQVLYDAIVARYPSLKNYFTLCYALPITLYSTFGNIKSQSGVHQGDPLGGTLFCIVLEEFMRSTGRRLEDFAYFDDLFIKGKNRDLIDWVDCVAKTGPKYGLLLQLEKSKWVGLVVPPSLSDKGIVGELPDTTSLLRAPVGSVAHVDESMLVIVKTWRNTVMKILKIMDPQTAFLLLRWCLGGSKFSYHCRVTPPYMDLQWRKEVSNTLRVALGQLSGVEVDDWMLSLASISPKNGGLGLRDCYHYYSASYISSVQRMLPAFTARRFSDECKGEDADMMDQPPPVVTSILRTYVEMAIANFNEQANVHLPSVDHVLYFSKGLIPIVEQKIFENALDNCDERSARLLWSHRKRYSNEWLRAVPNEWDKNLRFTAPHFRSLLAFFLGSPHPVRRCAKPSCEYEVDIYRDHSLLCRGREMNTRSNLIIEELEVHFKKVATVKLQALGDYQQERPGDLAITWNKDSKEETIFIDVSVTHQHIKNAADNYKTNHLEYRGRTKCAKYFGSFGDRRFVPFIMTSTGELSMAARNLVDELAARLQILTLKKGVKRDIMRGISCALQRGNAMMLCSH
jgi:hypothetical protein